MARASALFLVAIASGTWLGCWSRPQTSTPLRTASLGLPGTVQELANGLRVVVVPDPSASEVTLTMQYAVGTSDDPAAREGMAHLVEHLLYEPRLDGVPLHAQLHAVALAYNGTTTLDRTTYWSRAWAAQLESLLAIETARLTDPCATVTDADFTRQRDIVTDEQRGRAGYAQIEQALGAGLYPRGHAHHRRTAVTYESLAAITREEACAFAAAHYSPARAVLVLGGAIDTTTVPALLARTVGTVARPATARATAVAPTRQPQSVARVPLEHRVVVLAWRLPVDPVERARRTAVLKMITTLATARIAGELIVTQLGAADAPLVGIVIEPAAGRSTADVLDGYRQAFFELAQWFGTGLYEAGRARAVYDLFAALEPGVDRDERLAEHARAGRDPIAVSHAELAAILALDRSGARALTGAFELDAATVVVLDPGGAGDTEPATGLREPTHELPAAPMADALAATTPEPLPVDAPARAAIRTRVLENGLRVVLAPTGPAGAVDVRVVIPAGSAHEPAVARGLAQLAAHALQPAEYDDVEMLRFVMAGGAVRVDVGAEHTTFATSGVGANVDVLLTGLGMFVQGGDYDDLQPTIAALRKGSAQSSGELLALLAWHRAIYGDRDPRVGTGLWQPGRRVEIDVVRSFRRLRYVPEGATLIVTGGFDADITDRWVEASFGDWRGKRLRSPLPTGELAAYAFAQPAATPTVELRLGATAPQDRAAALVIAELLDDALGDVRRELGASYALGARLLEEGGVRRIIARGEIHAARAPEAFALIRRRLDGLAAGKELDNRFVLARRRVMSRLLAVPRDHRELGAYWEAVVQRGSEPEARRAIDVNFAAAEAVRTITLETVRRELARMPISQLAFLLRGPPAAITAAFSALGRRPVQLAP